MKRCTVLRLNDANSRPMSDLFKIIHEDSDLLVINKPAGLVCHPTKGDEYSSLISRVRLYLAANPNASTHRPPPSTSQNSAFSLQPSAFESAHLINRLDRETSGVTVVAKNSATAGELGRLWESREVEKEYLAIVHGHVRDDQGLINAPLGKDEQSRVVIKDCVRPDGSPAQTEFNVLRRFTRTLAFSLQPSAFTLLRLFPRTGRKHQIRIHVAHIGHPIVGDKLYGGDEDLYLALVENRLTANQRKQLLLPFHALHASKLTLRLRNAEFAFEAVPEVWFTDFIKGK